MSETDFNIEILEWCRGTVKEYQDANAEKAELELHRLTVTNKPVYTGAIPSWREANAWTWCRFNRQMDAVIGLRVSLDGDETVIPLIATELKAGRWLNTDELDKKSAIYGPLRESYPWVHTVFLHEDMQARGMGQDYLMRNGRHFDTIYTDWNETTQRLFRTLIFQQLEYQLEYWQL